MKKSKVVVIVILIVLICSLTFMAYLYFNRNHNKVYSNDNYTLAYDSSWTIKTKKDNYVMLEHDKDSYLSMEITDLNSDSLNNSIEDLKEEILYNISKNNKDYNLIYQEETTYTKNKYNGYKVLYETNNKQVMVGFYKSGSKLVTIIYESSNELFDILLDSVLNIIYNFDIKSETFNLDSKVSIQTKAIKYESNTELDKLIYNTNNYEIANNNYVVNYTMPDCFKLNSLNSVYNIFNYQKDNISITIKTSIMNKNVYEYINKDISGNVYGSYSYYQKDDKYSNYTEQLDVLTPESTNYIYKNSYTYSSYSDIVDKEFYKDVENIELIYALNNNHIFVVKIEANNTAITKKLVEAININSSKNYASYITVNKEDNYLIAKLEKYINYNSDEKDIITIKVPDKYKEVDKGQNIYLERYFELGYNESIEDSDYSVHYEYTTLKPDQIADIYNKTYISDNNDNHLISYVKDVTYNDKVFKLYEGGYTAIGGVMLTTNNRNKYYVEKKMLFYPIDDNKLLYIDISGNNKEITDDLINELSLFDITKE